MNDRKPHDAVPEDYRRSVAFPIGEANTALAGHFTGRSYIGSVAEEPLRIHNVTFEPGCRNHWHVHRAKSGGGQVLLCVGGRGFYQARGEEPVELVPGKAVVVPPNTEHWHGAAPDSWFSHLAIAVDGEDAAHDWLGPVTEEEYAKAAKGAEKT
ncbi:MAG: cupin domain-containing protein [Oscillospiraceae bacterium]|nr:cupin domain-containing protein [Oscillospiraceae bacterium]